MYAALVDGALPSQQEHASNGCCSSIIGGERGDVGDDGIVDDLLRDE